MSSLKRTLQQLRDEYPDMDYAELMRNVGVQILNAVEMSSQEEAWYLLRLNMSESIRDVEFIATCMPEDRHHVRKSKQQMDEEELAGDALDIWKENVVERYERRPMDTMADVSLAQFVALYEQRRDKKYRLRRFPRVIRYVNYDLGDVNNYKREMVLLHVPFRNEVVDILDHSKYIAIYDEKMAFINEARKEFEANVDIAKTLLYIAMLNQKDEDDENGGSECINDKIRSEPLKDDFAIARDALSEPDNADIILANMEKMTSVIRKRENVMTSEQYCKAMRKTNEGQRNLILECLFRICGYRKEPIQIFLTGPAGCGKTFTMKLIMETYNRFSQVHNSNQNAYVAAASTGIAATNLDGITVHSALQINMSNHDMPLSNEAVNSYRIAFLDNVKIMFIDECSMIGAELLAIIDSRLKQIMFNYDEPFGGLDIIFSGDLRQLPPVRQTPIYKRRKRSLCEAMVWQALKPYTLTQVMRQTNETFSSILTKIGNGEQLDEKSKALIESRFISEQYAREHCSSALRLFHTVAEVDNHNALAISGEGVISHMALDLYAGYNDAEQLASARNKVHKMKIRDTGGLPYILHLQIDKQYMITTNIDVADGLVNGATGILKYIEYDYEEDTELQKFILERIIADKSHVKLKRLWLV